MLFIYVQAPHSAHTESLASFLYIVSMSHFYTHETRFLFLSLAEGDTCLSVKW